MDEILAIARTNLKSILAWILVLVIAVGGGVYGYGIYNEKNTNLDSQITNLQSEVSGLSTLRTQVVSGEKKIEELDTVIEQKKSEANKNDINTQEFVQFIGERTTALDLSLNRIINTGYSENYGVYTVGFDIEVQGEIDNIISIINDIDSLGIGYNIQSLTLRDDADYSWLARPFDVDNQVPWYQEAEKPVEESDSIDTLTDVKDLIIEIMNQYNDDKEEEEQERKPIVDITIGNSSSNSVNNSSNNSSSSSNSSDEVEEEVDLNAGTIEDRLELILEELPDSIMTGGYSKDYESDLDGYTSNEDIKAYVKQALGLDDDDTLEDMTDEELEMYNLIVDKLSETEIVVQDEQSEEFKFRILIEFLTFNSPDNTINIGDDSSENTEESVEVTE